MRPVHRPDGPTREYAEVTVVEDGITSLVIYDTENPSAWVQSTQSVKRDTIR